MRLRCGLADAIILGEPESPLSERVARAGRELATLMERFPRQAPVDPLADFAPMETLLAGR